MTKMTEYVMARLESRIAEILKKHGKFPATPEEYLLVRSAILRGVALMCEAVENYPR